MIAQDTDTRFRWLVIGPFVAVVVLLAALGLTSTHILSAVRAYVGVESLWSKGQKDAVYHLVNYAHGRRAEDYQRFVDAIAVPLGDHIARIAGGQRAYLQHNVPVVIIGNDAGQPVAL